MLDFKPLLTKLAAIVSSADVIDPSILERQLGMNAACATLTKTPAGDFILSGACCDPLPGLVDVLVAMPPRRSIVIVPEIQGTFGAFESPPDIGAAEIIESKTGLGFVWRAPCDGVFVGLSAKLPERTIQTIFCDAVLSV